MAITNPSSSLEETLTSIKNTLNLSNGVNPKESDENETFDKINETLESLSEAISSQTATYDKHFAEQESFNPLENLDSFLSDLTKTDDEKSTGKSKDKPTPADVVKLDPNYGLGSLLVYYKLDEISDFLRTNLGGGNEKSNKKTGLTDIFSNLVKGAAGIGALGVGIMAFAGSMALFNLVDWGQALKGMALFSGVIIASIFIAKEVGKEAETFEDFSKGIMFLSLGFMAFSVALVIMNYALESVTKTIVGVGLFMAFVGGMTLVAKATTKATPDFIKFSISSVILSVGLMAFGGALKILDMTMNPTSAAKAGIALVAILGVFAIVGLVGVVAGAAIAAIAVFSTSVILLSVGLMAFGGALLVLENTVTEERIQIAQSALMNIVGFALSISMLAQPLALATISSVLLTVFSVTFFASATMYTLALNVLQLSIGKESAILGFLGSLGILISGILPFIITLPFGVIVSTLLMAFSVTLLASSLALWGVFSSLGKVPFGKQQAIIGGFLLAILELTVGLSALAIPLTLGIFGAVALANFSLLVVPSLLGFTDVIKAVDGINLSKENRDIYIDTISSMSSFMLAVVKMLSSDIKSVKKNAKLFSEVMSPIVEVFLNTFDMLKQVANFNPPDNLDEQVQVIFSSLLNICNRVSEEAENLKGSALRATKKFGEAFLPVSEVLVNMMSVLEDSQNLPIENGGAKQMISNIADVLTSVNEILFPTILELDKAPSTKKLVSLQEVLTECNKCIELLTKNDSNIDISSYLKTFYVDETQIQEVSKSLDSLQEIFKRVAYMSALLDGTKTMSSNLERMAFSFESIYKSTVNLDEAALNISSWEAAISQMADTFNRNDVASKMDIMSSAFSRMTTSLSGIEEGLKPLNKLANNASIIIKVANAITTMANATKGMNGAAINDVDKLYGAKNKAISETPMRVNKSSSVEDGDSPEQAILAILQAWRDSNYGAGATTPKRQAEAKMTESQEPSNGGLSTFLKQKFGW